MLHSENQKNISLIRNFCIIAHIDHGKSTLADRFLELTETYAKWEMKHGQMLDTMDLEQERGITIKLQPVRMIWKVNGTSYILNLIDTPGHVDFSYEVSRSLAACEGALLIVDATQGIQAQTLAHCYEALDAHLTLIPVLNKIDLAASDVELRSREIEHVLGFSKNDIIAVSAKEGTNIKHLLNAIVSRIPPPSVDFSSYETKGLVFDSYYDSYKGVVVYIRLFVGNIRRGDKLTFLASGKEIEVLEVGFFKPQLTPVDCLSAGEVGYVVTGLKSIEHARVGDTLWRVDYGTKLSNDFKPIPLPGYKKITPYVFASIFCIDGDDYPFLRDALMKLSLNDASLTFEPHQSDALGHGFLAGFLGLLHLDIVRERLEREYGLDLIVTAPNVSYEVITTSGEVIKVTNPSKLPEPSYIAQICEPWARVEIIAPKDVLGRLIALCSNIRGVQKSLSYLDTSRVLVEYEIPLAKIVVDFYDRLKSISSGYASMNYKFLEYRPGDLVKLDILIAGEQVSALSAIVHRDEAYYIGQYFTKRLKEVIPKMLFEISIQAVIGSKVIARETLSALRKDVTAKLYGGDRTRKDKLLKKQKEGKKKMKQIGKVALPKEAFLAILKK